MFVLCEIIRWGERKGSKIEKEKEVGIYKIKKGGGVREGRNKVIKRDKSCFRKELLDINFLK